MDLTDRLLEGAIKTMMYILPRVLKAPKNYDYRAEMMWCGTIAHNGILGCGRIEDWASHNIEHELSGALTKMSCTLRKFLLYCTSNLPLKECCSPFSRS